MKKNFVVYFVMAVTVVSAILVYHSHMSFVDDVEKRYLDLSNQLHLKTKTLIEQKQESTLLLALSLSQDKTVKKALQKNDYTILSFKDLIVNYGSYTSFKNVWIHLVTLQGNSFLKSWTDKRGENILNIRKDIVAFFKAPKVTSLISVGKYDMTLKVMVPIYENKKLLGLFEVITKVDSIAKKLAKENVMPIVLVDKKYKNQLKFPFTNMFIKDYYVANFGVKSDILEFTQQLELENLLKSKSKYQIIKDKFLSIHHLKDVYGKEMGYFLLYKDLNKINILDLKSNHINFILIWFGMVGVVSFVFFYLINKKYTKFLQLEVAQQTQKVREINENLQKRIQDAIEINRQNEIKLYQQEKFLHIAQMFQTIAHHWRQPLSMISTALSVLELNLSLGKVDKEEIQQTINDTIVKTEELSENIEFFSKTYNKNDQIQKIELQHVLNNAIKVLEPLFKKEDIEIIKNCEEIVLEVEYNESEFTNVIVSILQNSYESLIKTEDKKRQIIITLYKKGSFIHLSIEDTGIGIKEEILSRIFEPYITTKHQAKGVGLSLYVVYSTTINDLHGFIEASNTPTGAKIDIKLPLS